MNQQVLNEHRRVAIASARLWTYIAKSKEPWEKPEWAYDIWENGCPCCEHALRKDSFCGSCVGEIIWRGERCYLGSSLYVKWQGKQKTEVIEWVEEEETESAPIDPIRAKRYALRLAWAFQALHNDLCQVIGYDE